MSDYGNLDKTDWFVQKMRSGWLSRPEIVNLAAMEFPDIPRKRLDGTTGQYWSDCVNPKWSTCKTIQSLGLKVLESGGRRHLVGASGPRPRAISGKTPSLDTPAIGRGDWIGSLFSSSRNGNQRAPTARKIERLGKAAIAAALLGIAVSCTQAPRQADRSELPPQPYSIQRDALGESLESFVANNPSCKPKPGAIDNSQKCVVTDQSAYAGMPVMGRTANFYEGRLYDVDLLAPTSACKQFDLLSSLKQKFGASKSTEIVNGKEITPAGADFKIWQNGVSTITFSESMGELDACTIDFQFDAVYWKVSELKREKRAKEEALKKKDM